MATLYTVGVEVQTSAAQQAINKLQKSFEDFAKTSDTATSSVENGFNKATKQQELFVNAAGKVVDAQGRFVKATGISTDGLRRYEGGVKSAGDGLDKFADEAEKASNNLTIMRVALGNIIADAVVGGVKSLANQIQQLGANVIRTGAQAEKTAVAFETFLGSAKEAKKVMKEVRDFAATTPFELPEVTNAAKQLLATRTPANELIETIARLGEIAAGADKPLSQLLFIYTQVKNQGRATGEDINQLLNAGLSMEDIARALGKTAKELGQMKGSSQGLQLTFEEVDKVLRSVTSEGGRFAGLMDKLGTTTAVKLSNLNDAFTKIYQSIYDGISPAISGVLDVIVGILDPLGENKTLWAEVNAQALDFKTYLEQNPDIIKTISNGLEEGINVGLKAASDLAKGLLGYLEDNPDAIAKAVEQVDLLIKGLARAYEIIALSVEGWQKIVALGQIFSGGDRITPTSGAERILAAGGSTADVSSFQGEIERRIAALPFWDAFNNAKKEEIVREVFQTVLGRVNQRQNVPQPTKPPPATSTTNPKSPTLANDGFAKSEQDRQRNQKDLANEQLRQEKAIAERRRREFEEQQRRERAAFQDRQQYEGLTFNQRSNFEMRLFDLQTRHQEMLREQRLEAESEIADAVINNQRKIEDFQRQAERRRMERQFQQEQQELEIKALRQQRMFEQSQANSAVAFNKGQVVSRASELTSVANSAGAGHVWARTGGAKSQPYETRGRSTGPHLHAQAKTSGLSESQIRAIMDEYVRVNGRKPSSFGESRASAGHGYTAIDYLTPQGSNMTLLGNARLEFYHKGGRGGLMAKLVTPKGSVELGHLLELSPPKAGAPSSTTTQPPSTGGGTEPYAQAGVPGVNVTDLQIQGKMNALKFEQSIALRETALEQEQLNQLFREQADIVPQMIRENVTGMQDEIRQLEVQSNLLRLQGEEKKDYLAQLEYERLYLNEKLKLEKDIANSSSDAEKLALQKAYNQLLKEEAEILAVITVRQVAEDQLEAQKKQTDWVDSQISNLKSMRYALAAMSEQAQMATRMADNMGNAFGDAFSRFVTGSGSAQEAFASFMTGMANVFAQELQRMTALAIANNLLPGLLNLFAPAPSLFSSVFNGGSQFSAGSVTGLASGVNLPGFSVPALAEGGIVTKPTMALIGEAGKEAVIPLDKLDGMGNNVTINVSVSNDGTATTDQQNANRLGRELESAVVSVLQKQKRPGGLLASVR